MARLTFRAEGVIPATLLAFNEDFSINEQETRRHLRHVGATRGISALTVNGHASEVHACAFDEQERLLAIAAEELGDRLPLVSGIYADGSHEAARIAGEWDRGVAGFVRQGSSAAAAPAPWTAQLSDALGGYYGEGRRSAAVSYFLLGVPEVADGAQTGRWRTFGRVGSGYKVSELSDVLRAMAPLQVRCSSSAARSCLSLSAAESK